MIALGLVTKAAAAPGKGMTVGRANMGSSIPAHRPVGDILADPPKGRFPIPRPGDDDEELHPYYCRRSYRYAAIMGG